MKYNEAGYVSVMIVTGAMEKAGGTDAAKVAAAISASTWSTPEGPMSFVDRSMQHHFYTQRIHGGEIQSLAD